MTGGSSSRTPHDHLGLTFGRRCARSGSLQYRPHGDLPDHSTRLRLSGRSHPAKWPEEGRANMADRRGRSLASEGASRGSRTLRPCSPSRRKGLARLMSKGSRHDQRLAADVVGPSRLIVGWSGSGDPFPAPTSRRSSAAGIATRSTASEALRRLRIAEPQSYTASFSSLAGRNAIFLLALILIASPVAGFRPILAARFRTRRMPRPVRRIFVALLQMPRGQRHQVAQHAFGLLLG